jgi:hypothetical protein
MDRQAVPVVSLEVDAEFVAARNESELDVCEVEDSVAMSPAGTRCRKLIHILDHRHPNVAEKRCQKKFLSVIGRRPKEHCVSVVQARSPDEVRSIAPVLVLVRRDQTAQNILRDQRTVAAVAAAEAALDALGRVRLLAQFRMR